MRSLVRWWSCAALVTLVAGTPVRVAACFADFFQQQKVGQEMTLTGEFYRFPQTRRFFRRDYKTGRVDYFTFFGVSVVPTTIIGNGTMSQEARSIDSLLLLFPDEGLVQDLPETGEQIWFTGTLLGYQYGASGITDAFGIGGMPYILLKRFSDQAPDTLGR